jgi:hypothetical protein
MWQSMIAVKHIPGNNPIMSPLFWDFEECDTILKYDGGCDVIHVVRHSVDDDAIFGENQIDERSFAGDYSQSFMKHAFTLLCYEKYCMSFGGLNNWCVFLQEFVLKSRIS